MSKVKAINMQQVWIRVSTFVSAKNAEAITDVLQCPLSAGCVVGRLALWNLWSCKYA